MRKNVFGKKFKRDINERKALFKSLMSSLVLQERIKTTEEKAKAIRGQVEKLVTQSKKKGENATSLLSAHLSPFAIKKMITDLGPRFVNRPGGYTRIIKLGRRRSDSAKMALMEWVETSQIKNVQTTTKEEVKKKNDANVKIKETEAKKSKVKTKIVRKKKGKEEEKRNK